MIILYFCFIYFAIALVPGSSYYSWLPTTSSRAAALLTYVHPSTFECFQLWFWPHCVYVMWSLVLRFFVMDAKFFVLQCDAYANKFAQTLFLQFSNTFSQICPTATRRMHSLSRVEQRDDITDGHNCFQGHLDFDFKCAIHSIQFVFI